jgi:hypothetical protein
MLSTLKHKEIKSVKILCGTSVLDFKEGLTGLGISEWAFALKAHQATIFIEPNVSREQ